jgi:hypothetical protein
LIICLNFLLLLILLVMKSCLKGFMVGCYLCSLVISVPSTPIQGRLPNTAQAHHTLLLLSVPLVFSGPIEGVWRKTPPLGECSVSLFHAPGSVLGPQPSSTSQSYEESSLSNLDSLLRKWEVLPSIKIQPPMQCTGFSFLWVQTRPTARREGPGLCLDSSLASFSLSLVSLPPLGSEFRRRSEGKRTPHSQYRSL